MKRTTKWKSSLCFAALLALSTTTLALQLSCSDSLQLSTSDEIPILLDGVIATPSQVGPLVGSADGIATVTFDAPDVLRAGEYFQIRIGSSVPPGGSTLGSAVLYLKDAPTAFVLGAKPFASPVGQGEGDNWSIDIRGQLSPKFAGDSRVYDVQVALVDAQGRIGQVVSWKPMLIAQLPPTCPADASCGAAQCGFESVCGTYCGELDGACAAGLACTTDLTCVPVGPACPDANDCGERSCGTDSICGVSCGQCESGFLCSDRGQCVVDDSTTDDTTDETTDETSSCPANQIQCDSQCIAPLSDPRFCGASGDCLGTNAGTTCDPSQRCDAGSCVENCSGGDVSCGGSCVDPDNDPMHCGAADPCETSPGDICSGGKVCSQGACAESCDPASELLCAGKCVEPASDHQFCGAVADCAGENAGTACNDREVCVGGICQETCASEQIECGDTCIDPQTNSDYCGASADCQGANAGVSCKQGEFCVLGSCAMECPNGEVACGNRCVNPQIDLKNCGAVLDCMGANAGKTCVGGERCESGICNNPCADKSDVQCESTCIDPKAEDAHCGAKLDCSGENAGEVCINDAKCQQGTCIASCEGDEIACGSSCIDPKTSKLYCGVDANCSGGKICNDEESCIEGDCYDIPVGCEGVIVFSDLSVDNKVRELIGKPSGPLRLADMLQVKDLAVPQYTASLGGTQCLLNLESFYYSQWESLDITPLSNLPSLKKVQAIGLDDQDWAIHFGAGRFTKLQELSIDEIGVINRKPPRRIAAATTLNFLDDKPDLRKLSLRCDFGCTIDSLDLSPLAAHAALQELSLQGIPLAGVQPLSGLTNLENILMIGGGLTDVSSLGSLYNLESLSLWDNNIKSFSTSFAALSKLKVLLADSNPELGAIDGLSGLTGLEVLSLNGTRVTDIASLSALTKLRSLNVSPPSGSSACNTLYGLNALNSMPLLERISIVGLGVSDVASVSNHSKLNTMSIAGCGLGSIEGLAGLPALRNVNLSDNELSDISALGAISSIEELDLDSNSLTTIATLADLVSLTSLSAVANDLSAFDALYQLASLKSVDLQQNSLSCTDSQKSFVASFLSAGNSFSWDCN